MIRAYFFDMDGTLVDTEILWVEAMEQLAQEHGYTLPIETATDMVYGIAWPEVYACFREQFPELTWSIEEMGAMLAPYFLQLRDSRDIRIHGSIQLMRRLAQTHPVAIVSGSYRGDVEAAINIMGIGEILSFYLSHEDYAPGKPHSACYVAAAKKAGVAPESCVVFEDSTAGLCAAKDAGMYCVALARPGRPAQDYSRADLILEDLADFHPSMLKVCCTA